MRRALVLILGLTMIAPATVVAQEIGGSAPGLGANDWREEPNVRAPGRVPFSWYGSPSAQYPADRNNLDVAQSGTRALVLQSKWMPYLYPTTSVLGTTSGLGLAGAANPDANNMFRPFVGRDFIYPTATYSWLAFHGTWVDTNADGFRDDEGHWRNGIDGHDRQFFANADPAHNCQQGAAPTVDPSGDTEIVGGNPGNAVPASVAVPIGVEWRCTTPDEWEPPVGWGTTNPEVVTYVTPGTEFGFDGPVLRIPCPIIGLHNDPPNDCDPVDERDAPDIDYTAGDFYGDGTYSWSGVFFATLDGSFLETKVAETISSPVLVVDGPRTHEPGPGSLVDTDVYSSVDPTAESLFQNSLHGAEAQYNAAVESTDDDTAALYAAWTALTEALLCHPDPLEAGACVADPVYGPAFASVVPPRPVEDTGHDHASGYHLYLDLEMRESAHYGAVQTARTGDVEDQFGVPSRYCVGDACGNLARLVVDGNLGAWWDKNGDGMIGDPVATATCDDAYDCGTVRDPHEYEQVDSRDEFIPFCFPDRRSGWIAVTLTPDGGRWGTLGAYVDYDEASGIDSTQGGRASFNPYDDIVLDAADGDVDRLVLAGPIQVHATCVGNDGVYDSFEEVILLGGRAEYGITMRTELVTLAFESAGIVLPESVEDVDHMPAFA